jgi:hypothetical protein
VIVIVVVIAVITAALMLKSYVPDIPFRISVVFIEVFL